MWLFSSSASMSLSGSSWSGSMELVPPSTLFRVEEDLGGKSGGRAGDGPLELPKSAKPTGHARHDPRRNAGCGTLVDPKQREPVGRCTGRSQLPQWQGVGGGVVIELVVFRLPSRRRPARQAGEDHFEVKLTQGVDIEGADLTSGGELCGGGHVLGGVGRHVVAAASIRRPEQRTRVSEKQ